MNRFFSISLRTIVGLFSALVGAGAFLGDNYLTWLGGISLALFATVNPSKFKEKVNVSYWLTFSAWTMLFLFLSYMDMDSGVAGNH